MTESAGYTCTHQQTHFLHFKCIQVKWKSLGQGKEAFFLFSFFKVGGKENIAAAGKTF